MPLIKLDVDAAGFFWSRKRRTVLESPPVQCRASNPLTQFMSRSTRALSLSKWRRYDIVIDDRLCLSDCRCEIAEWHRLPVLADYSTIHAPWCATGRSL
jgi:hypothetical protein